MMILNLFWILVIKEIKICIGNYLVPLWQPWHTYLVIWGFKPEFSQIQTPYLHKRKLPHSHTWSCMYNFFISFYFYLYKSISFVGIDNIITLSGYDVFFFQKKNYFTIIIVLSQCLKETWRVLQMCSLPMVTGHCIFNIAMHYYIICLTNYCLFISPMNI